RGTQPGPSGLFAGRHDNPAGVLPRSPYELGNPFSPSRARPGEEFDDDQFPLPLIPFRGPNVPPWRLAEGPAEPEAEVARGGQLPPARALTVLPQAWSHLDLCGTARPGHHLS